MKEPKAGQNMTMEEFEKWLKTEDTDEDTKYPLELLKEFFGDIRRWFKNALYWLRTHTINRYHLIDCRSPINDYDWGWMDRDRLILYASFNILKNFVEKEIPHSYTDWTVDGWREARQEIDALYVWWTGGRAKRVREINDQITEAVKTGEKAYNLLEAEIKMDDEMLMRLIKVRGYMWT